MQPATALLPHAGVGMSLGGATVASDSWSDQMQGHYLSKLSSSPVVAESVILKQRSTLSLYAPSCKSDKTATCVSNFCQPGNTCL